MNRGEEKVRVHMNVVHMNVVHMNVVTLKLINLRMRFEQIGSVLKRIVPLG